MEIDDMVTTTRPARPNTPARWAAALARAATEGVRVVQLPTTGVWVATSGTDATTGYVVTETGCECYAGQHGDPVCKHRAALRSQLDQLTPVARVAVASGPAAAACTSCLGTGWARMYCSGRLNDYTEVLCRCTAIASAAA